MRTSTWRILRAVSTNPRYSVPHPGGYRSYTTGKRTLHTSPTRRRDDDPAETSRNPIQEPPIETPRPQETPAGSEGLLYWPDGGPENPPKPKDRSNYGSATRRQARNRKGRELPPMNLPSWFLDRNVSLDSSNILPVAVTNNEPGTSVIELAGPVSDERFNGPKSEAEVVGRFAFRGLGNENGTYTIQRDNFEEIDAVVSAGLKVPSWQRAEVASPMKPHPVLFCPKDGAEHVLENLVRFLAATYHADFLVLNPEDIAEIGGDYMDEKSEFRSHTLSSLGYEVPQVLASRRQDPNGESEDEYDDAEEDHSDASVPRPNSSQYGQVSGFTILGSSALSGTVQELLKSFGPSQGPPQKAKPSFFQANQSPKDNILDQKLSVLTETLLDAPEIKRAAQAASERNITDSTTGPNTTVAAESGITSMTDTQVEQAPSRVEASSGNSELENDGLIVFVHDYAQINTTVNGGRFLDKLHEVVQNKRKDGERVLIVGGVSTKDLEPSMSWAVAKDMENNPSETPMRTIITPVSPKSLEEDNFQAAHKERIKKTNIRHIRDMLRRTAPNFSSVEKIVMDWEFDLDSQVVFNSGLDESIWSIEKISRVTTTALGRLGDSEMQAADIKDAIMLSENSDHAKRSWFAKEKEQPDKSAVNANPSTSENTKDRLRKLRKNCNEHEKKLLSGVVNPEDIRTSFSDVQAPAQTIDALKTLTSLSLVRPDAFRYGVLATDRIPGLLLYGPPGTGKTLLAKAVAKESGATVLEVSGSDVYDMYVGEGEKNVKAIFSLAKKLTPCVVFIDEADAILGARSGGSNRTSHRELINQFLREWDGMTESSAFIMVATNRPFDLDDASLRRLPRRLLVDLPVEKDREAILGIHLKDELLDPEVSLTKLASQTPFYSGSDLKNLSVAAALACVREEYDTAAAATLNAPNSSEPAYPAKRTLHQRHFDKAMEEISASISEDMGSLSAIRKFDEKYGDRRGKRKKGGYGFKTVSDSERMGSDMARVRNQT